jgi:UDP-N-acetylmuramate dehydrogenase
MVDFGWKERLESLLEQPVEWGRSLDHYTSLGIGGPADAVATVEKKNELGPVLRFLAEEKLRWRVLGRGTNVLARDEGFAGVILLLGTEYQTVGEPVEISESGAALLQGGGGCSLGRLSRSCIAQGLSGLEFCCGIPGTLGGAVVMNAGAWGGDMASVVRRVTLATADGEKTLAGGELDFCYRRWRGFEQYQGQAVVTEVEFALQRGDREEIKKRCRTLQERRKAAQPVPYANAGSFFKNPPNDSAGRLIEACGLKGTSIGGAMVSEQHGNFLVNRGKATASDMLSLMKVVQNRVKNDNGIELEPEVHFI